MKQAQAYPDDVQSQARYDHLRAEIERVGMEWLGEWKGFQAIYAFRCLNSHDTTRYFGRFTQHSRMLGCPRCLKARRTEELQSKAKAAGVELLVPHWLGGKVQHPLRCPQGHTWMREGKIALYNMDCPQCTPDPKLLRDGMERLHAAARTRGGECLSVSYQGVHKPYVFRCANGHIWQTNGNAVLNAKTWCPTCRNIPTDRERWRHEGLIRLAEAAAKRGGETLAAEFKGIEHRYRFRCSEGHEWEAVASTVLSGKRWCKACALQATRKPLEEIHRIAQERGGQCLSTEYRNNRQKLNWLCHRGHSWQAAFDNINAGRWCPVCARIERLTSSKSKVRQRYEAHGR